MRNLPLCHGCPTVVLSAPFDQDEPIGEPGVSVWVAEGGLFREQNIRYTLNPAQSSRLLRSRVMLVDNASRPGQSRSAPLDPAPARSDAGLLTAPWRGICQAVSARPPSGTRSPATEATCSRCAFRARPPADRWLRGARSISRGPQWRQSAPRQDGCQQDHPGLEHRARRGNRVRG